MGSTPTSRSVPSTPRSRCSAASGNWCLLFSLLAAPRRNGELRRLVPAIAQKMLTQQLRELEHDGIIARTVFDRVPPKVVYEIDGTVREPAGSTARSALRLGPVLVRQDRRPSARPRSSGQRRRIDGTTRCTDPPTLFKTGDQGRIVETISTQPTRAIASILPSAANQRLARRATNVSVGTERGRRRQGTVRSRADGAQRRNQRRHARSLPRTPAETDTAPTRRHTPTVGEATGKSLPSGEDCQRRGRTEPHDRTTTLNSRRSHPSGRAVPRRIVGVPGLHRSSAGSVRWSIRCWRRGDGPVMRTISHVGSRAIPVRAVQGMSTSASHSVLTFGVAGRCGHCPSGACRRPACAPGNGECDGSRDIGG